MADNFAVSFWVLLSGITFAGVGFVVFRYGASKEGLIKGFASVRLWIVIGTTLAALYIGFVIASSYFAKNTNLPRGWNNPCNFSHFSYRC